MSHPSSNGDAEMASPRHDKDSERPPRHRNPIAAMIEDFEPIWFTLCMNAGVIGEILNIFPYNFNGVHVLGTIAYLVDLVLFIIFASIMLLKFLIYPKKSYTKVTGDAEPLVLMGCAPIAFLTIAALTGTICSNAPWGGHGFMIVGYALWWIGVAWTLLFTTGIYITLFRKQVVDQEKELPPAAIIPAVAVATAAATGAYIVNYSYDMTPALGLPVIIVGYMLTGVGMFLAIVVYAITISKLISQGYPPPEKSPSMVILVGPMGQTSTALQLLGAAANTGGIFAAYPSTGPFISAMSASALDAASIMLSLLLYGFGLFLLASAILTLTEQGIRRNLTWSMTWWSSIFPIGVMTTAALAYSTSMGSDAWRVATCIGTIVLIIQWFTFLPFTVWNIFKGELLIPKDARKGNVKDS